MQDFRSDSEYGHTFQKSFGIKLEPPILSKSENGSPDLRKGMSDSIGGEA
jgi:hypothetical protein